MSNSSTFETSDIAIASYLMIRDLKLLSATKSPGGRFKFIFEDLLGVGQALAVEFMNSEFSRFDNQVRNLKKLLNG
jgi:hypothetical protein